jgi:hypothetical protein
MRASIESIDVRNYEILVQQIPLSPVSAYDLKAERYDFA